MLTARRPLHRGASLPSASNARVPKELDDLLLRALSPNPQSRPQSAAGLAADLRVIAAALDAQGLEEEDEPAAGGSKAAALILAIVVVVVVAAIGWWISRS